MESAAAEQATNLSEILERVRRLDDQLEIQRIIMTHPPAADTADGTFWHQLFGEEGRTEYARDAVGLSGLVTADQLVAATNGPQVKEVHRKGLAHFASAPIIRLGGDVAEAWNYHQTLVRIEDGYRVLNVFANHWRFARTAQGWRAVLRRVRLIDGNEEAIDILRDAVSSSTELMGGTG